MVSYFFTLTQQPNAGQDRLILEVSRSHTVTHHSSRTPLDEGSACRRDLYLTTNNTHNRQTSMHPAGLFCFLNPFCCSLLVLFPYLFLCLYNTQHKHPCPRRYSNPLFQQICSSIHSFHRSATGISTVF
jgi:hypothetical protein